MIDPCAGVPALRRVLGRAPRTARCAVIRRSSAVSGMFVAMRMSLPSVVPDPRADPAPLRRFLADAFAVDTTAVERRAYPRAAPSGVRVVSPRSAELEDVSPYGARLRMPSGDPAPATLRLSIAIARLDGEHVIESQVAGVIAGDGETVLRLRFVTIADDVQQELFKVSKASLLSRTIATTFDRCQTGPVDGYRQVSGRRELRDILGSLVSSNADLSFAALTGGRLLRARAEAVDEGSRHFIVTTGAPEAFGPVGTYASFMAALDHKNYLMDGYVLARDAQRLTLSWPSMVALTDQRAQQRIELGLGSPLSVRVDGNAYSVTDVSARGMSFYAASSTVPWRIGDRLEAEFDLGEQDAHRESIVVRHTRTQADGCMIGVAFVTAGASSAPEFEVSELRAQDVAVERAEHTVDFELVRFETGKRKLAGLWCETHGDDGGDKTAIVIPPAWAKTKESTSLLAQVLCASYAANGRHCAVLRLDYSNALGESDRAPEFDKPGHETYGLTFTACIEDIRAAIDYAHERLGQPAPNTVLIGMSFSGPLCLRAATSDERVTHLVELMGASDIQDLVRMATGGIDYVANYRAGIRSRVQNVLGILSDTDRWCNDGIAARLVYLQDAQDDAAQLSIPILWVHGRYDAFVNESRIRSILECAGGPRRELVVAPFGHIPTKGQDAIATCVPVVRSLLGDEATVATPDAAAIAEAAKAEWARAPRTRLASPRDYWRSYMLGETENSLGFDVLAMTREYSELMTLQVELLGDADTVHDLGGGMGTALPYLTDADRVVVYDLVPQLLERARQRGHELDISVDVVEWDADSDPVPAALSSATTILMSLFLSCLGDPESVLASLHDELPEGASVVASSIRPDADLSAIYTNLLDDLDAGRTQAPEHSHTSNLRQSVRDYMNSAAWLLRLADEGTFQLFDARQLEAMFERAGFSVLSCRRCFGTPPRAVVVHARKSPI